MASWLCRVEAAVEYREEDYLALSGIQHFVFCRRQWALIHIEQIWNENLLTTLGLLMHERAHDEELREKRGDTIIVRGLRVHSARLGLSGACDVVEFQADEQGYFLAGEDGLWRAVPIEYKRGKAKATDADRLQLCAQAMCLEEMLACDIPTGYLYYGETKSRELVTFSVEYREAVNHASQEMHDLFARRYVPHVKSGKGCRSCSLVEACMPKTVSPAKKQPVESYLIDSFSSLNEKREG